MEGREGMANVECRMGNGNFDNNLRFYDKICPFLDFRYSEEEMIPRHTAGSKSQ